MGNTRIIFVPKIGQSFDVPESWTAPQIDEEVKSRFGTQPGGQPLNWRGAEVIRVGTKLSLDGVKLEVTELKQNPAIGTLYTTVCTETTEQDGDRFEVGQVFEYTGHELRWFEMRGTLTVVN